ncbi:MAG: hypothetical protein QXL15_01835 [Candidatus Korarchaeota archaeon]
MKKMAFLPVLFILPTIFIVPAIYTNSITPKEASNDVVFHPWATILATSDPAMICAMVPESVYLLGETFHATPLLSTSDINATCWFLEDWYSAMHARGFNVKVRAIGVPSLQDLAKIYSCGHRVRPIYQSDNPILLLNRVVNESWINSSNAVLVPYLPQETLENTSTYNISFGSYLPESNQTIVHGSVAFTVRYNYPYVNIRARADTKGTLQLYADDIIVDYMKDSQRGIVSGIIPKLHGESMKIETDISFNINLTQYRTEAIPIFVDEDTSYLEATLNANKDLDLYILYNNRTVASSAGESGVERVVIKYPAAGNYTIVVVQYDPDPVSGELRVIRRMTKDIFSWGMVWGNAGTYASRINAPILFTGGDTVPDDTINTLRGLGVKNITLVSFGIANKTAILNSINSAGISLDDFREMNWSNYLDFFDVNDTIVVATPLFSSAASLLAAKYGAPVIVPSGEVRINASATWERFSFATVIEYSKDSATPHFYRMKEFSTMFDSWLSSLSLSPKYIIVVSPLDEFPVTADRALFGKYLIGRIPASNAGQAVTIVSRLLHHDLLSIGNSSLGTFFAYVHDLYFTLKNGTDVRISDERVYFQERIGNYLAAGVGEITSILGRGISYWHVSTHGAYLYESENDIMYNRTGDPGVILVASDDVKWGYELSPGNPDSDGNGIVDASDHISGYYFSGDYIDARLGSLHSSASLFVVCLVGSSRFPLTLMRHGMDIVIAPIRTISFDGGGYVSLRMIEAVSRGDNYAMALNESLWHSAPIYSIDSVQQGDASLQFILYGDPHINATAKGVIVSEDNPDNRRKPVFEKIFSLGNAAKNLLEYAGVNSTYFANDNVSEFLSSIHEAILVVIDCSAFSSLPIPLLEQYVEFGGTLALFNASGSMVFNVSIAPSNLNSTTTSIIHPLLYIPNRLNLTLNATGFIETPGEYFILASSGVSPTWIAGTTDLGRYTIIAGEIQLQMIENILSWVDSLIPNLKISYSYASISWLIIEARIVYLKITVIDEFGRNILSNVSIEIECAVPLEYTIHENYILIEVPPEIDNITIKILPKNGSVPVNPRFFTVKCQPSSPLYIFAILLVIMPAIFLIGVIAAIKFRWFSKDTKQPNKS